MTFIRKAGAALVSLAAIFLICQIYFRLVRNPLDDFLIHGIKTNDVALVKRALAWGASVNARDDTIDNPLTDYPEVNEKPWSSRNTALILATWPPNYYTHKPQNELMDLLLEKGADPNLANLKGMTPLHKAARFGDDAIPVFKALIEHHADPNLHDARGGTPLTIATYLNEFEVVKFLLAHGADVNAVGEVKMTAIYWAAGFNANPKLDKYLLEHGANLNVRNAKGQTPLHFATGHGRLEAVELLLEYGANPDAKDKYGQTPLAMLGLNGKKPINGYFPDVDEETKHKIASLLTAKAAGNRKNWKQRKRTNIG